MCPNTTFSSPNKLFFLVPKNEEVRTKWCKAIKRDERKNPKLSAKSSLYCCADHFNLEEDTENFIQYQIMTVQEGGRVNLRLKKGIVPHKFQCQRESKPTPERVCALKRERLDTVKEALLEAVAREDISEPDNSIDHTDISIDISERHQDAIQNYEAGPSTSSMNLLCVGKYYCDKAIQVNSKAKYRSKGVNVKMCAKGKSVALSPFFKHTANTSTSPFKSADISNVRTLFPVASVSDTDMTSVSSVISSHYETDSDQSSSGSNFSNDDSDENFKNLMRRGILTAVEMEPKMLLGLPKTSYHLIKLLSKHIPAPTIDIMITLKKIKLNDSFSILGLHFGYAQSTVSRIFSKTLPVLAEKMRELIVWPEPSNVVKNLPISFRARYSNVVSIIDCLEIEIEKPSNAVQQSLTWSHYKKCNTLKYLISCTPDGLMNFISEGYGGRASDVIIVEDCGYLEYLPPNAAVMADRVFKDLSCLLENKKCTLIRPPSVYKSMPSTKEEVKQSKRIAALRIHVERVINRLREFHMLLPHACIDHNLIPRIDEVISVACGIINMQEVLIKI